MSVGTSCSTVLYCSTVLFDPWGFTQTQHSVASSADPKRLFFLEGGSVTYFKTSSANVVIEVFGTLSAKFPQSRCAQHNKEHQCSAMLPVMLPLPLALGELQRIISSSEILNRRKGSTEKATEFSRKSPVETRHRVFHSIFIYVSNENQIEHQIRSVSFRCNNEGGIKDMHNFSPLFARQ